MALTRYQPAEKTSSVSAVSAMRVFGVVWIRWCWLHDRGERPAPIRTVTRTGHLRIAAQRETEKQGGGSSPLTGWAISSRLPLLYLCCNPARPQQVKHSVSEKADAENRKEIQLALACKTVNSQDRTGREEEERPRQSCAASCLNQPSGGGLKLDVPVHKLDDRPDIILAVSPTSQTLGEIGGTLRTQALAA